MKFLIFIILAMQRFEGEGKKRVNVSLDLVLLLFFWGKI